MHLLVDGHNLIGQTPQLSLSDADDEAQLVLLLRRYATRKRGQRVIVVFDHGVYGHPDRLDGYGVECFFARSPQDADSQLIQRLRALKHPREWALISSDRQIVKVAKECGTRVISSQDFARSLAATGSGSVRPGPQPGQTRKAAPPGEQSDVRLSEAEIKEWLDLFGEPE